MKNNNAVRVTNAKPPVRELPVKNQEVPLSQIVPHPENYNEHPEEQLRQLGKSYETLGQFRSVVLWEQKDGTYMQLAGHGVVEAMKRSGAKEVRADILPSVLSPLVAKQIMIADNLHAQQSIPDEVKLAELLTEQQDAGIDLSLLGTDAEYIKQLVDEAYKEEKEDEQKNLLSLLDITIDGPRHVVRAGEVWQLGPHILAVVHVFRDWAIWNQYLQGEETLFLPFPGPFVALSKKAREGRMVLVQPETYIAGHILDRYAEVHGEQSLRKIGDTSHSLSFSEEEEIDAEV